MITDSDSLTNTSQNNTGQNTQERTKTVQNQQNKQKITNTGQNQRNAINAGQNKQQLGKDVNTVQNQQQLGKDVNAGPNKQQLGKDVNADANKQQLGKDVNADAKNQLIFAKMMSNVADKLIPIYEFFKKPFQVPEKPEQDADADVKFTYIILRLTKLFRMKNTPLDINENTRFGLVSFTDQDLQSNPFGQFLEDNSLVLDSNHKSEILQRLKNDYPFEPTDTNQQASNQDLYNATIRTFVDNLFEDAQITRRILKVYMNKCPFLKKNIENFKKYKELDANFPHLYKVPLDEMCDLLEEKDDDGSTSDDTFNNFIIINCVTFRELTNDEKTVLEKVRRGEEEEEEEEEEEDDDDESIGDIYLSNPRLLHSLNSNNSEADGNKKYKQYLERKKKLDEDNENEY